MASIQQVLRDVYNGRQSSLWRRIRTTSDSTRGGFFAFNTDAVEVPTFLCNNFGMYRDKDIIFVTIPQKVAKMQYSTLDPKMKKALLGRISLGDCTAKIEVNDKTYYVLQGMVMDSNWKIIMMCSWVMRTYRYPETGAETTLKTRPLLRIDPSVFSRGDAVQKYIADKIFKESFMKVPYNNRNPVGESATDVQIKIIIDEIPLKVRFPQPPNITTTNQELLDLADYYLEDTLANGV